MEVRNTILVVAVLIATATFQAILNPPGGVVGGGTGDNNKQLTTNENHINATIMSTTTNNNLIPTNNVSYINATIFSNTTTTNPTATVDPSKRVLLKKTKVYGSVFTYRSFFENFYVLNTVCFLTSVMVIIFVIPSTLFGVLLFPTLVFLMLSYGMSFVVISPASFYAIIFSYTSYAFATLVYVSRAVYEIPCISRCRSQRLQMLLYLLERS
ncbi:uncharacterized protein LOC114294467 [Camellia sinensis]|uniref:uncharacterized protein LOC114294467 n=1 Tax=Camellia sinensis TaxID=4442 RepID=UPI00103695A6|nr:uncharacterized protein LOC114294467 [Camellia sinensis]